MNLKSEDIKLLQKIHTLSLQIENQSQDAHFNVGLLAQLVILLKEFQFSDQIDLQKLSEIPDHLHPGMSLRHFVNFMIPVERLMDRHLKDDQFLITSTDLQAPLQKFPLYFVLDNIRSAFNVGSIFRLGDCVGVSEILLCGYTVGPENEALQKTSLSAAKFLPSRHFPDLKDALTDLKAKGVYLIGLETSPQAISIYSAPMKGPTAFVVGNERFGLDHATLALVDEVRKIPVYGVKNSLNVANTLSIAAYEWSRQNV